MMGVCAESHPVGSTGQCRLGYTVSCTPFTYAHLSSVCVCECVCVSVCVCVCRCVCVCVVGEGVKKQGQHGVCAPHLRSLMQMTRDNNTNAEDHHILGYGKASSGFKYTHTHTHTHTLTLSLSLSRSLSPSLSHTYTLSL